MRLGVGTVKGRMASPLFAAWEMVKSRLVHLLCMTQAAFVVALLTMLLLASATVAAGEILGTEDEPELEDPSGNVDYSPLYLSSDDREHIDLLAGWFEYLSENDTLLFTLKVVSLEGWLERTDGWRVLHQFQGNVTNSREDTGQLTYSIQKHSASNSWSENVYLETSSGQAEVPFAFELEAGAPGYFRWYVPMAYLQNWGVQIGQFTAVAAEEQYVGGVTTGVLNVNQAQASGSFTWEHFEPSQSNDSTDEHPLTPSESTETSPISDESTAGVGVVLTTTILVSLAWLTRQSYRR